MTFALIERAGDLLARYDVLFCDVWGVVHNGLAANPGANFALTRFRSRGGTVILLSNAPTPSTTVAQLLDHKAVNRKAWDAIVTSGDLTRRHWQAQGYVAVHHVGPARDDSLFEGQSVRRVPLAEAQALVVTGLVDDANETAESYRPLLERALGRGLPLLCANPDLLVEIDGVPYACAGAIAEIYERMGGVVVWAGKPYKVAYERAFAEAVRVRGAPVPRETVLAIGDAVRTDLAGASRAGIDALFVASGIHREALTVDGRIDPGKLAELAGHETRTTVAAIDVLTW
jgi:HAD superfamily hydrolase (TIGR01459 family)